MRLTMMRVCVAASVFAMSAFSAFAGGASLEYAVKGAYIYKMLPFVDWPASTLPEPGSPITICILGHDPFGNALDNAVANLHVGTHPVSVRRDAVAGDPSCRVAFIAPADPQADGSMLQAFDGKPVLTVTDSGAPTHGVVAFVIEKNHVRFDIDDAMAERDGLSISSKLLKLARAVNPRKAAP
jgi:hypothetical protein